MKTKSKPRFNKLFGVLIIILTLSLAIFALDAVNILNEALENVTNLETISLELKVGLSEDVGGNMKMILKSHLKEEVSRLEFISPKEFAGQIIIVDKPKDQFVNYYPTGQAVRMPLSNAQTGNASMDISALMDFNTSDLANLDKERYIFEVEETTLEGILAYVISVRDSQNEVGLQKVWLNRQDKFPLYMESYDPSGRKIMTMTLSKVEKNKGLDLSELRALPKTAIIFDM